MKKIFQWAMAAALIICGASVFTACSSNDDNPAGGGAEGIAMIVKNGDIDYFRQIETSFRSVCKEKGLEAYYYATSAETAYQEQVAAVGELRKLGSKALKGIVFAPSFGPNGESAEAEVAALAKERGIPVVIIDSPVKATSPLASCPYFGTDNTAAGRAMADEVKADRVAVFAMTNSPGIERAEAFKALKPGAVVYQVADQCNDEVQAVLSDFDDFVFFNGNDLVGALPMLKAAGKRVYTFDAYGEFLDELIAGSPCLRGIMAQNTFGMARKAVEAVIANARQGEMVPTFYITGFNLDDPSVQPFLDFYGKQLPVIEGLSEKIIGKWMLAENDGQIQPTNMKAIYTFISTTIAYMSTSGNIGESGKGVWNVQEERDVAINGNKVTLSFSPNEHSTVKEEYNITSINDKEFTANVNTIVNMDGEVMPSNERTVRFVKQTADYSAAILGLWECTELTGIETYNDANARLEFLADGTYRYYRKNDGGEWQAVTTREFQNYFVDGTLLATRWKNQGEDELREWWEIASLSGDQMTWTALRQNADGSTAQQGMTWKKVQ